MYDLRCIKCKRKLLEYRAGEGCTLIDIWCRKSHCKTKNKFVIVDGDIIARIVYGENVTNKIRKVVKK